MAKPGDFDFYCEEALSGKTSVEKLYESDAVLAFYHTRPSYEIHIIIIPKEHIHDLLHLEKGHEALVVEILAVVKQLAKERESEMEAKGLRLLTNMGKFQDTPHLHFHLVGGEKL